MSSIDATGVLPLSDYRTALHLDESVLLQVSHETLASDLTDALRFLLSEYFERSHHHGHHGHDDHNHDDDIARLLKAPTNQKISLLRQLLTMRPAGVDIEESVLLKIDSVMDCILRSKKLTEHEDLPNVLSGLFKMENSDSKNVSDGEIIKKISIWKGDITTLSADCIVNAANNAMLGCFQPDHPCIDNAIHWQAGPRLRSDCNLIMEMQGDIPEPVGLAKATRGYNLPAKYVLHTVGPQIPGGRKPTDQESKQLESCYLSCLETAEALKGASSIAFCCISTGLYGFPQDKAVTIAVNAVIRYLKEHPTSQIQHVVFNVFKVEDEALYISEFEKLVGSKAVNLPAYLSVRTEEDKLNLACKWVKEATDIFISAGAGLSAAAGLDYTSEEVFKKLFPAMHKRGFKNMYQFIGYTDWEPKLQWGYLLSHSKIARFGWPEHEVYTLLKDIAYSKLDDEKKAEAPFSTSNPFFVKTSNADGIFSQRGWPLQYVWTPQGDYSRIQCLKPCRPDSIFSTKDFMEKALPKVDHETQEITDPSVIPVCPNCKGPVMYNVRGGDWYLESPHLPQEDRCSEWLSEKLNPKNGRKIVILEIGAGFNTPSVLRWPDEELATDHQNVRLIRINAMHHEVPEEILATKAIGLGMDATEALRAMYAAVQEKYM
jgi:O-acetyl-ADP-ribose deacetylase (regulator of RNase III)/NAD-dependent SIR2 family protein deacetylase